MEALAAIALAGNVLQFVQVGFQIIAKSNSIKRSHDGTLKEHADVALVLRDLDVRLESLNTGGLAPDDSLKELVHQCRVAGNDLHNALNSVRTHRNGLWSSYRAALSSVWHDSRVRVAEESFARFQQQIHYYLQTMLVNSSITVAHHVEAQQASIKVLRDSVEDLRVRLLDQCAQVHTTQAAMFEEVRTLRHLHGNLTDLMTPKALDTASDGRINEDLKSDFLTTLSFHGIDDRENMIPDAHVDTFEWLLSSPIHDDDSRDTRENYDNRRTAIVQSIRATLESKAVSGKDLARFGLEDATTMNPPLLHFQRWLANTGKDAETVFWIWGKPGCGKSTLMKALVQKPNMNQRVKNLCSEWAEARTIIFTTFFFFRPGMALHRSACGFLRSLLTQIFKQRCATVRAVFSLQEQRDVLRAHNNHNRSGSPLWTPARLLTALRAWRRVDNTKLFLHVDGIDEIDAPARDMVDLLAAVTSLGGVKILAAGRHTPEFEEAFDSSLTFEMDHATRLDIMKYTVDSLHDSSIDDSLDRPSQFCDIALEIVHSASGVFQWVAIVVASLVHGAKCAESFDQLWDRLKQYPKDLHRVYESLYQNIDPIHRSNAAFWLLAVKEFSSMELLLYLAGRIKPWEAEGFSATTDWIYRAEQFGVSDCESLVRIVQSFAVIAEAERRGISQLSRRMRSQCPHFFDFRGSAGDKISFTHRTVLDFIEQPSVNARLHNDLKEDVHPRLAVAAVCIASWSETIVQGQDSTSPITSPRQVLTGFPTNELARVLGATDFAVANKFYVHLHHLCLNEHVFHKEFLQQKSWYITCSGAFRQDSFRDILLDTHAFPQPLLKFISLSNLGTAYHELATWHLLTIADREKLILASQFTQTFAGDWHESRGGLGDVSLAHFKVDDDSRSMEALFQDIFPEGIHGQSVGLAMLLDWLELQDKTKLGPYDSDGPIGGTLNLMSLLIGVGARFDHENSAHGTSGQLSRLNILLDRREASLIRSSNSRSHFNGEHLSVLRKLRAFRALLFRTHRVNEAAEG